MALPTSEEVVLNLNSTQINKYDEQTISGITAHGFISLNGYGYGLTAGHGDRHLIGYGEGNSFATGSLSLKGWGCGNSTSAGNGHCKGESYGYK